MSRIERHIVNAWARRLAASAVNDVISDLEGMKAMFSGDSGLANVWEEICAQVQGEESSAWPAYENLVEELLDALVNSLDRDSQLALWATTDAGWDYIYDHHADQDGVEGVPLTSCDIVSKLTREVWAVAANYESPSLYRHIWGEDDPWYSDEDDESDEGLYESEEISVDAKGDM